LLAHFLKSDSSICGKHLQQPEPTKIYLNDIKNIKKLKEFFKVLDPGPYLDPG
jgi:hypothetical protein